MPECLNDVKDEEAKAFIRRLIAKAPTRPSAGELLKDPFITTITAKDKELIATLQLVREALARKIVFLNVDLYKSDARYFLPEDGKIRMPFNSLAGLGDTAAERIVEARTEAEFYSVEDLRVRTGISKSVIEILRRVGALKGLPETNQFSIF